MLEWFGNKLWQTEFKEKAYKYNYENCSYNDVLKSKQCTCTSSTYSQDDHTPIIKKKLTRKEIIEQLFGLYCLFSIAYVTGKILTFVIVSIARLIISIIR